MSLPASLTTMCIINEKCWLVQRSHVHLEKKSQYNTMTFWVSQLHPHFFRFSASYPNIFITSFALGERNWSCDIMLSHSPIKFTAPRPQIADSKHHYHSTAHVSTKNQFTSFIYHLHTLISFHLGIQIRTHFIRQGHENIDKTLKAAEIILSHFDQYCHLVL